MEGIVHVKDPKSLIEQVDNINQTIQNIARVKESLAIISDELASAWNSDTIDRESYFKNLNSSLIKLDTLIKTMMSLSGNLNNYAYTQMYNIQN